MIELPEAYVLASQIEQTLVGKTIRSAAANTHPHGFATYTGDPTSYNAMLAGKKITKAGADLGTSAIWDSNVEIICGNMLLSISTPIKYHAPGEKLPAKHQLLLEFEDGSHMSCTVQMWGSMFCVPYFENAERRKQGPSPLADAFDKEYFASLWDGVKPTMSAKAFLATEKRIPGLGNGVLQDILFNAGIHPKRKLQTMSIEEKDNLFHSVKFTLKEMKDCGGRDTEKDLFNHKGGYQTILSNKTLIYPCRICGNGLKREAYLGGNIYYCPVCQPQDEVR
jgi:Formamidopyrimidine-DNA glycosylase